MVDWKTGRAETADPLQLAIYRLAWAEVSDFRRARWTRSSTTYRTDQIVRPTALPDRIEAAACGRRWTHATRQVSDRPVD